jgi:adenylate cyclase
VFDGKRHILLKNGAAVAVGQRGTALLATLLAADGRVVTKTELMNAVWHTEYVEESNLSVQIAALRKCLGRKSGGDEWIVTVQRVGYQIVIPAPKKPTMIFTGSAGRLLPSAGKSSIAVLPFTNMSRDPQHDYFADATTEDIITALSRVREFFVISRTSSFAYKQRAIEVRSVAKELGVKYVLEGSVRVSGTTVRVTAQLVDGESGGHVWAERYDRELDDIFSVQDEITRHIVLALQVKLSYGDLARLWEGQTRNLRAWEKMAQGRDHFLCFDPVSVRHAIAALNEALVIDPNYTGAMIQLGLCHWWQARYDTSVIKETSLRLCEEQAKRALSVDAHMGSAYMLLGGNALLRDQHTEAITLCERAIALSPGDSWAMAFLGLVCIYGGQASRAVDVLKLALRLSPHPPAWYIESYAMASMWNGDADTAISAAEENRRRYPDDVDALMDIAVVYGFYGRDSEAAQVVAEIRSKHPAYTLRDTLRTERYRELAKLEKIIDILRRAGLPE